MSRKRLWRYGTFALILLLTNACAATPAIPAHTPSALNPHGPAAAHLASLWWVMFGFGTAIFLLVIGLLFAALLRRQRGTSDTDPDSRGGDIGRGWPIWGGIILPFIVLAIVFGYNIYTLSAVENPQEKP